jgi:alkylhydroperoxidase/carboxymuconolactone decarboxylase family protein YurZ
MPDETEDRPVLETLGAMTAASLERCDLAPDALLLVRIAALAAVDARPVSYLAHIGPAADAGVTLEDVQNVLVAVAPIVGTARVVSAAANIAEALGFALAGSGRRIAPLPPRTHRRGPSALRGMAGLR